MPSHILALDVGTTTVTALIISLDGSVKATARAGLTSNYPAQGRVEQNAETVWELTQKVIREALASAHLTPNDIASIGVTTQRSSIVVWDKVTGQPLAPMVIWSDLRGAARATELMQMGFMIQAQHAAAKVELVVAGIDAANRDAMIWGNIDSFIIWKLSGGAHITDQSQAWGTGYLSYDGTGWNTALIEAQNLRLDMFPNLVDTRGELATTETDVFGARVPIAAIIADQQSALIAHGCLSPGQGKVTYGTSGVYDMCTGLVPSMLSPTMVPWIQSHVGGETTFCLEGMVLTAGAMFDWLVTGLGVADHARDLAALAETVEGSEGVGILPALWGLGAPHGSTDATAMINGIRAGTNKAHIVLAAFEGVAFRVREITDMVDAGTEFTQPEALPVDGGATAIIPFMQVQANILNRPIKRHSIREATAFGAALSAGLGMGLLQVSDIASFVKYDRVFEPEWDQATADQKLADWKTLVHL